MTEINATTNMDNKKVSMRPTVDHKFKLMMLGDAGVGKTSIARRFVDDAFLTTYIHTIGIDFLEKMVEVDQKSIKLQIWDTAGQDRFRTLIRPYYRGAAGMVLVYDVTDEKTFHDIEDWMRCIVENTQEFQIIQKVIVANKTDLDTDLHRVSSEDGRQLAAKHGIEFFEVSAKEGNGICEAFLQLTKQVLRAQSLKQRRKSTWSNSSGNDDDDDEVVVLHQIPIHAKKDKQCCKK